MTVTRLPTEPGSGWDYCVVRRERFGNLLKLRPAGARFAEHVVQPLLLPLERNDIDFDGVGLLLLDITMGCDVRCPFCYSEPWRESRDCGNVDYEVISQILQRLRRSTQFRQLNVGCDFEPALGDDLELLGRAAEQVFSGWRSPTVKIVTNGMQLRAARIEHFDRAFGESLHVRMSLHSHNRERFNSFIREPTSTP
jgi:molybdenum cofactor biosynthesis enzyme MoaA